MDTQTLKVAPKVGQLNIVLGDEIVARVHESDRRDYAEAQNYADEMVRRFNSFPVLVDALEHVLVASEDGGDMSNVDWKMLQELFQSLKA